MQSQYINNELIYCELCGNNKYYYNEFYKCNCNKDICPLCYQSHDQSHKKIEYKKRFSYCYKHALEFLSYCNTCNCNLCKECEQQHIKHKIITYKSKKPNDKAINGINNDFSEFNKKINLYKKELIRLNEYFSDFIPNIIKDLDNYISLYTNIFNSFFHIKNYESLRNIFNVKLKKLYKEINSLLNEENNINKFKFLLEMSNNYLKNEMNILYKKNGKNKIKIFDNKFVQNNKNNCYLLIDNKKIELCENYDCDINQNNNEDLIVTVIEKKRMSNLEFMFKDCIDLFSFQGLQNWNTIYVHNMNAMFSGCISLKEIPDISQWKTNNVENMSYMFECCSSLKTLPDISLWNTNKVNDISYMFSQCSSLISLPNLSNWNIKNVDNISNIFNGCSSLKELPDISKWNTINVNDMKEMFKGCSSLIELPDISQWNTENVKDLSSMFEDCTSLIELPNISCWNTSNVVNISAMFNNCSSLKSLPDISKWNTS